MPYAIKNLNPDRLLLDRWKASETYSTVEIFPGAWKKAIYFQFIKKKAKITWKIIIMLLHVFSVLHMSATSNFTNVF